MRLLAAALLACSFVPAALPARLHAQIPTAITSDPAPDRLHPAGFDYSDHRIALEISILNWLASL